MSVLKFGHEMLNRLTATLAALDGDLDGTSAWPEQALAALRDAGWHRWVIPQQFGGEGRSSAEIVAAYEAIARGSVAVALLATQRDGACDLLARSPNDDLRDRLLPAHARGERFTSIGISQLTTSKGAGRPKMLARETAGGFELDGVMPWVTGAIGCDEIVCGAVLEDGRELLACVPCDRARVIVDPPMRLLALDASCTSQVRCENARIDATEIIRGPAAQVLKLRTPVKSMVVISVGLGLAGAIVDALDGDGIAISPQLSPLADELRSEYALVREACKSAAAQLEDPDYEVPKSKLRVAVNALLTRLALVLTSAAKGSGYARPHIAERLMREAMFFQVWSAPADVQAASLRAAFGAPSGENS